MANNFGLSGRDLRPNQRLLHFLLQLLAQLHDEETNTRGRISRGTTQKEQTEKDKTISFGTGRQNRQMHTEKWTREIEREREREIFSHKINCVCVCVREREREREREKERKRD